MSVSRRVVVVAALLFGAGCDKKEAPVTTAPAPSGLPPLAADPHAPAKPGDRPVHEPANPHGGMGGAGMAGGMPAGHPPVGGMGGSGAIEGATPGDIPFDPKSVVSGVIRADDKVKAKIATGDVIYLVARSADKPGPPLAVKRLTVGTWPIAFTLDGRDAMMEGTKLGGKVIVNARVDKDGDAMTKNPGDVTGATRPIEPPADKVVLTLDTVL
jgi:cytochrome c-type biogenesis protein CcmH